MDKIDFRKALKPLYSATAKFAEIDAPPLQFVMVDGAGDPNTSPEYKSAVEWLYATSYALKFAAKAQGRDYVVPPLEGLWWSSDPQDFIARRKDRWSWTMMILTPNFVTATIFDSARIKSIEKLGDPPSSLRLASLTEGRCLQVLHTGSYDDEGPVLSQLHDVEIPARGLTFNGHHHEIYLSDPRKTAAAKLKTILRQPVRPL